MIKIKKIVSLVLLVTVLASALGNFQFSAAEESFRGTEPVFLSDPQLLSQLTAPSNTVTAPGEEFSPHFADMEDSDLAPQISGITEEVKPNGAFVIEGANLDKAEVYTYGILKSGKGAYKKTEIETGNDTTVTAVISDEYKYGMYLVWVKNSYGMSSPVRINAPVADWVDNDYVFPGETVNVYGKNFSEETKPYAYIDGYGYAEITGYGKYKISFKIPTEIKNGDYKVYIHNGKGGKYGWSKPVNLTVNNSADEFWNGKSITVDRKSRTLTIDKHNFTVYRNATAQLSLAIDGKELLSNNNTVLFRLTQLSENKYKYKYIQSSSCEEYIEITINGNKLIFSDENDELLDQHMIEAAVRVSQNHDTVYISADEYLLTRYVNVETAVRFIGSSDGETVLTANFGDDTVTSSGHLINYLFAVSYEPSGFENIVFKDTLDSVYSPCFIRLNVKNKQYSDYKTLIKNCEFLKYKTYGSKNKTEAGYDKNNYADIESYIEYANVATSVGVDKADNVHITDNKFITPKGLDIISSKNIVISNNLVYGTWVLDEHNGPCFLQSNSTSCIDISGNKIYGYDKLTDPNGDLEEYDKTFCRGIVFQNPYGPAENIYIANNDIDRVGSFIGNSGEIILVESPTFAKQAENFTVSGNRISYDFNWDKETDGKYYYNSMPIEGMAVILIYGKGASQYRKIVKAVANSVELDRPFDIQPDETTKLTIVPHIENMVIYGNNIVGPKLYNSQYNATKGINGDGNMLDFIADGNTVKNVYVGIALSPHYTDINTDFGNYSVNAIVENNKVENVKYGININLVLGYENSSFTKGETIYAVQNAIVRNNLVKSTLIPQTELLKGVGGDAIAIGTEYTSYIGSTPNPITSGKWIKNTVVEGNEFENIQNACVKLQFNQGDTVLRKNKYAGAEKTLAYDQDCWNGAYRAYANKALITDTVPENVYIPPEIQEEQAEEKKFSTTFKNGDFSDGLKYWGSVCNGESNGYDKTTDNPNLYAECVSEDNGNKCLYLNNESDGISQTFAVSGLKNGDKLRVLYDYRLSNGTEKWNFKARIFYTDAAGKRHSVSSRQNCPIGYRYGAADGWNSVRLADSSTQEIEITGISDSAGEVTFTLYIYSSGAAGAYVDNIELLYYDCDENGYKSVTTLGGKRLNTDSYTEIYGTEENGINSGNVKTNTVLNNLAPLKQLVNGDFSKGLKYWAPYENNIGSASDYAAVSDGILTVEKTGLSSMWISVPAAAIGKEVFAVFEYAYPNAATGEYATIYVRPDKGTSGTGYLYAKNDTTAIWRVQKTNVCVPADGAAKLKIQIKLSSNGIPISFKNIRLYMLDGGNGYPVSLDGTPVAYSYGDANADGRIDVRDLVKMKKYTADKTIPIYLAAANLKKASDPEVKASDLILMKKMLLGVY